MLREGCCLMVEISNERFYWWSENDSFDMLNIAKIYLRHSSNEVWNKRLHEKISNEFVAEKVSSSNFHFTQCQFSVLSEVSSFRHHVALSSHLISFVLFLEQTLFTKSSLPHSLKLTIIEKFRNVVKCSRCCQSLWLAYDSKTNQSCIKVKQKPGKFSW